MLIRMSQAGKITAGGFTIVAARNGAVYQLPDELGRALVDDKDAVPVDANTLREALPPANILAGRVAPANG